MKKNPWSFLCQLLFIMLHLSLFACSNKNLKPAPISAAGSRPFIKKEYGTQPITHKNSNDLKKKRQVDLTSHKHNDENFSRETNSVRTYRVKRGDTLFHIARITGNDYRVLAKINHINQPYHLKVNQLIKLDYRHQQNRKPKNATSLHLTHEEMRTRTVDYQSTNAYSQRSGKQNVGKMLPLSGVVAKSHPPVALPRDLINTPKTRSKASIPQWRWPTDGKVIDQFSDSEGGNKGIDISGYRKQPIVSTADGLVVYAGNALRGYGNLIIIKHSDDYLSAYAHNDNILVREKEEVKAGQEIATMGSSGASSVKLHFEIRYKGKSVNPLQYLSQR